MNIIFSDESDFNVFLKNYVNGNSNVSWHYLPKGIEYQRIYCSSILIKDLSFIIIDNNKPVALCPLFLEQHKGKKQFTYVGGYKVAPLIKKNLFYKKRKRIERNCFDKIDELAREYDVSKTMFLIDPLVERCEHNILTEYGYLDTSTSTAIIDLSLETEDLWSNLRKSFKSLINNGKNKFNIFIMDYKNPDFAIHENYRKLHHKTSGRVTRPKETFDLQFDMLKEDKAILIGLQDSNKFIAFSYFLHYKQGVVYASSSDDPDFETDIPLEHCIIWTAIEYYKRREIKYIEMGMQQFGHQIFDNPNQKDLNISFFKRGFGGNTVSLYRGIKYYKKECLKKDLEDNVHKLLKNYKI